MRLISQGGLPLDDGDYSVDDVAERYSVHRDTVYKGVRRGDGLYPIADRKGTGPKAWLYFSRAAIEVCDRNRIEFYKTTPSWHELFGYGASEAPQRRSGSDIIADARLKGGKSK